MNSSIKSLLVFIFAVLMTGVRCAMNQRKELEYLCCYITRTAIANERLSLNSAGQVVLMLKTPYRDGTSHLIMSPLEFMQRLATLVPRPRLNLIRFMRRSHPMPSCAQRLFQARRKAAHPMRMTTHNIPRFPCVSVGRAC